MTVFLLAGLIPLGIAFEETGAARFPASFLSGLAHGGLTTLNVFHFEKIAEQ
jgi:di/tricarboxylate transporter